MNGLLIKYSYYHVYLIDIQITSHLSGGTNAHVHPLPVWLPRLKALPALLSGTFPALGEQVEFQLGGEQTLETTLGQPLDLLT
jgi:hypothetical protein